MLPRCAWRTTPRAGVSPLVSVLGTAPLPVRSRGPLEPGAGPAGSTQAALRAQDAPSRDCLQGGGRAR
jgi:hypothetical protein